MTRSREGSILVAVLVFLGCGKSGKDSPSGREQGDPAPAPTAARGTPAPTPGPPPGPGTRLAPEPLTVEEVRPQLPVPEGATMKDDLAAVGPAVTMEVCFSAADTQAGAQAVVERLAESGWEYRPPRESSAVPGGVVVDARKRPYLLRVAVSPGGETGCEGGARGSYFVSKNDASFGP